MTEIETKQQFRKEIDGLAELIQSKRPEIDEESKEILSEKRIIPYGAAVVVFYQPGGKYLMIQERFRQKLDECFALFGGTMEENETPIQTAKREAREELRLRRKLGLRYFGEYSIQPDPNSKDKTKVRVFTSPMRKYDAHLVGSDEGRVALVDGNAIQPVIDKNGNVNWGLKMLNGFNNILYDVYWDLVRRGEIISIEERREAA